MKALSSFTETVVYCTSIIFTLLSILSLLSSLSPLFFVNGSWTGSNNNAAHQSVLFDHQDTILMTPFRPWTISLDPHSSKCPSTFSVSDGLIFISSNSSVLAFSATNGRLIWSRTSLVTSRYETVSPTTIVSFSSILFVSQMRKTKGGLISSFFTSSEPNLKEHVEHGLVFVGAENCLYALSELDGSTTWSYCSSRVTTSLHTQPSVDEYLGIVVTAALESGEPDDLEDSSARLLGFDILTGKLLWETIIQEVNTLPSFLLFPSAQFLITYSLEQASSWRSLDRYENTRHHNSPSLRASLFFLDTDF
jgi:outer membrane protein assembly factor BamB